VYFAAFLVFFKYKVISISEKYHQAILPATAISVFPLYSSHQWRNKGRYLAFAKVGPIADHIFSEKRGSISIWNNTKPAFFFSSRIPCRYGRGTAFRLGVPFAVTVQIAPAWYDMGIERIYVYV